MMAASRVAVFSSFAFLRPAFEQTHKLTSWQHQAMYEISLLLSNSPIFHGIMKLIDSVDLQFHT